MKIRIYSILFLTLSLCSIQSCSERKLTGHEEMIVILANVKKNFNVPKNIFAPEAGLKGADSLIRQPYLDPAEKNYYIFVKADLYLRAGDEDKAIGILEDLTRNDTQHRFEMVWRMLALAYLRQGERSNCIVNHASESCIIPVKGLGVHSDSEGSVKAVAVYEGLLRRSPKDVESRWLYNIAQMTLGKYPHEVPAEFLIPNLGGETDHTIKPFQDVAGSLMLDVNNMAGGSITEDFDNDGFLDIMTSGWDLNDEMHLFKNNGNGTFSDVSDKTNLQGITGGLNIMQTDYNNDGFKDVFVTRGAWKREFGREPNSLLRNNGDGTFTDVTIESGLLSFHPTQTATWNDFNNDGWLDVFIGNETSGSPAESMHPCELFMNDGHGKFTEVAAKAHCRIINYVKGVTSGDYDHDGWKDIFLSTMGGRRILLKNLGKKEPSFKDVTLMAGLSNEKGNSFPTWFWDYDNDGWLDIFACDYTFKESLAFYAASEKLNIPAGNPEKMLLYHNNHDGTFTNVATAAGLTQNVFAMGSNFGDIDNDGFLDMYLGSGNPDYKSLVPNKMFRSIDGKKFGDVTAAARVGHLQKGHGVSFADMDNDGDQDIYIDMGGAFPGDSYQNSFFLNPGQNANNWICMKLEGTKSNRAAIGTQIKLTFKENGVERNIFRDLNSGGSFGASPLRREIGIGSGTLIDEIEIKWHGSGAVQVFKNVTPNQFIRIVEGNDKIEVLKTKTVIWSLPDQLCLPVSGQKFASN